MADRGDTHYYVPKLNLWFAGSSLLFLVAIFWMVIDDWNAPWKEYQKEFRRIEIARAEEQLASPELQEAAARESELQAELDRVSAQLDSKAAPIAAAEEKLFQAKGELWRLTEIGKAAKENYTWEKSQFEHHALEHGATPEAEARLEEFAVALDAANLRTEQAQLAVAEAESALDALVQDRTAAEEAVKSAGKDLDLVRKRLEKLAPSDAPTQVANVIRDFPGLDFIGPSLKVNKYVLDDLTFELNFTKKKRIDMCTTCHLAADRDGFTEEDLAEPFRSHPRLDLFLTAKSPHPVTEVGCTICHRGGGEALSFQHADHYTTDPEEAERWRDQYHWHKQHHWDYPMLASENIEASCIQCHKTSMELIADDAPKLTEGYRLVERYGCYSCHKIEWFPTKRKPGPSLKNMLAKLNPEFIDSWIAMPKDFRPTTWMPQLFHLENWPEDEVVAREPLLEPDGTPQVDAQGEPMFREFMGQEWNDTTIASIVAFLKDRAPLQELPAIPVDGDAERGREVMRVSGCYACHNVAPYGEPEEGRNDPAHAPGRYNQHGPNLRGVATKLNAEWLFAWIKNPHEYWADTNMPNLRLDDQDAADITAYIMEDPDGVFTDVPATWDPKPVPYDTEALRQMAREFFSRDGRHVLDMRFAGEIEDMRWDRDEDLLVAVGEKHVLSVGCYSCHEIKGLEEAMPIGTELTTWASKTVDKLDWAWVINEVQEEGNWSIEEREEFRQYRENWLAQKLHAPRSFDHNKEKDPLEKLKMPYFGFTDEQIAALSTFVVGLVEDEVQRAKMMPDAGQLSSDQGLRALRQKNCVACHVVEPGTVTFEDADGVEHTVAAELLALGEDSTPPRAMDMEKLAAAITSYEEYYEEELEELGFRLLEPAPGAGIPGESIFVERDKLKGFEPARGGDFVATVTDYYYKGIRLHDDEAEDPADAWYPWNFGEDGGVEDVDGNTRVYYEEPYDKVRWTFAPPVLLGEGDKLQRDWFYAFLMDPVALRQQIRVKMPTFSYRAGEAEGIADYFANRAAERWPSKYARAMRLALGMDLSKDFGDRTPWPDVTNFRAGGTGLSLAEVASGSGLSPQVVQAIENGAPVETAANFSSLKEFGDARGFEMHGPVDPAYESVTRRQPSHLDMRHSFIGVGQELAATAVNCYQCHFHSGAMPDQKDAPIAWAPDLSYARERLREDYVNDWLVNPGLIYPGTAMPANFAADPPQYQETYPDSTNAQQVEAVLDFLYNYDRAPTPSD